MYFSVMEMEMVAAEAVKKERKIRETFLCVFISRKMERVGETRD
jgi:hypothetical protein